MELTDILSSEEWAAFEQEIAETFHVNCAVFNASGNGITGTPRWGNKLCPKIKGNKDSRSAICAPGNMYFMAEAEKTGKSVIGECDAGMIKVAVPIFSDGQFLGTAAMCGPLPEGGALESFIIEKTLGLTPKDIDAHGDGLNVMPENEALEMTRFIENKISRFLEFKRAG